MESQEIIRVRPGVDAADLEQDPNLLFVILREKHILEMAGGPEMVILLYERKKSKWNLCHLFKGKMICLGHSKWNVWTEELL